MIFDRPVTFKEASEGLRSKTILPTSLSSEQLRVLPAQLRERAFFSAKVTNTGFLQEAQELIDSILAPGQATREGGRKATTGFTQATARTQLKAYLEQIGYEPDEGKKGTIQDLGEDSRLNLILKTQQGFAHGYGQFTQGQQPDVLDTFPALEFIRGGAREEPRPWPQIWQSAGGRIFPGAGDYPEGRMLALKGDPIWTTISVFGLPYPPFDFGSGMVTVDIGRLEAEEIGLLEEDEPVKPVGRRFDEDIAATVDNVPPDLLRQLLKDLGSVYKVSRKGVLAKA